MLAKAYLIPFPILLVLLLLVVVAICGVIFAERRKK